MMSGFRPAQAFGEVGAFSTTPPSSSLAKPQQSPQVVVALGLSRADRRDRPRDTVTKPFTGRVMSCCGDSQVLTITGDYGRADPDGSR